MLFNQLSFVRDELKNHPQIKGKPYGGVETFCSRIAYALFLAFTELEIFVFAFLQWIAISLAYFLWVQMLDWIPEEVWRSAADSDGVSTVDLVLLAWSFVCVGLAAYPVGILTGCMGATHFLHKQGRESTIAMCLKLVLPQSWALWSFHWADGWITVNRILERLPKKDDRRTLAQKALSETLYYAWKVGVAGVLPSIVTGNGLYKSGKNSVKFVKDNFMEVAKLRAGYSILCWIVGVSAYVGTIILFIGLDIVPKGGEVYGHIYTLYFWAGVPILIAMSFVMLILRPIYVIALCDLYSDYLAKHDKTVTLPNNPPMAISALVTFCILCLATGTVYLYRVELGVVDMLSVPYIQEHAAKKSQTTKKVSEKSKQSDKNTVVEVKDSSGLSVYIEKKANDDWHSPPSDAK